MKNILLVEDDEASRVFLSEFLDLWGYVVTTVSNGRKALQKIHETLPDLVICDIQMPVLDGFTFIRELREERQLNDLPVIALTAVAMLGDKEKILTAGFSSYHSKPVDSEMLRLDIQRLLELSSQAKTA